MRRVVVLLAAVAVLAACTPAQERAWLEWHAVDPGAALAFLDTDAGRELLAAEVDEEPAGSVWDELAWCESGGRWDYNGSSGYDGGLQMLPSVWRAYGGRDFAEYAWQASRSAQITVAERILDDVGWKAWPACSRKLGLR